MISLHNIKKKKHNVTNLSNHDSLIFFEKILIVTLPYGAKDTIQLIQDEINFDNE